MSVEHHGELGTTDRNQTKLDRQIQGNHTEDQFDSIPEYLNATLSDANATEEIDRFFFFQVSPRNDAICVGLGIDESRSCGS